MDQEKEGGTYLLRLKIFNAIDNVRETGEDVDFLNAASDEEAVKKVREFEANVGGRSMYRYKVKSLHRIEILREIKVASMPLP